VRVESAHCAAGSEGIRGANQSSIGLRGAGIRDCPSEWTVVPSIHWRFLSEVGMWS
jgi:hypothetical protein